MIPIIPTLFLMFLFTIVGSLIIWVVGHKYGRTGAQHKWTNKRYIIYSSAYTIALIALILCLGSVFCDELFSPQLRESNAWKRAELKRFQQESEDRAATTIGNLERLRPNPKTSPPIKTGTSNATQERIVSQLETIASQLVTLKVRADQTEEKIAANKVESEDNDWKQDQRLDKIEKSLLGVVQTHSKKPQFEDTAPPVITPTPPQDPAVQNLHQNLTAQYLDNQKTIFGVLNKLETDHRVAFEKMEAMDARITVHDKRLKDHENDLGELTTIVAGVNAKVNNMIATHATPPTATTVAPTAPLVAPVATPATPTGTPAPNPTSMKMAPVPHQAGTNNFLFREEYGVQRKFLRPSSGVLTIELAILAVDLTKQKVAADVSIMVSEWVDDEGREFLNNPKTKEQFLKSIREAAQKKFRKTGSLGKIYIQDGSYKAEPAAKP